MSVLGSHTSGMLIYTNSAVPRLRYVPMIMLQYNADIGRAQDECMQRTRHATVERCLQRDVVVHRTEAKKDIT